MANTSPPQRIDDADRVFDFRAHASLWFSLGVGLLVMQVGAYLVPAVGTSDAILAIVVGSVLGSALLAWTAKIACDTGLNSAGLMHHVYGSAFAKLPVLLNITQLVGWTTFELVVMRDGTQAMGTQAFGWLPSLSTAVFATLLWGIVLTALMRGSMLGLVRNFVSRFGLPLVIVSLLWISYQFWGILQTKGAQAFWQRSGDGSMGLLSAIDLVMAMPVSWLPLIADYARHGQSGSSSWKGTWLGYAIANAWCYALGVLIASVTEPGTDLVTALLVAQGGLIALGLILLDEMDNAYGDVYSAAVSSNSLLSRISIQTWGVGIAVVCTILALYLPMHDLEPFLLKLSSVFIPLYGVILGTLVFNDQLEENTPTVRWQSAVIWLIGIGVFHSLAIWMPQWGSSIPSLLITFVLAWLMRKKV